MKTIRVDRLIEPVEAKDVTKNIFVGDDSYYAKNFVFNAKTHTTARNVYIVVDTVKDQLSVETEYTVKEARIIFLAKNIELEEYLNMVDAGKTYDCTYINLCTDSANYVIKCDKALTMVNTGTDGFFGMATKFKNYLGMEILLCFDSCCINDCNMPINTPKEIASFLKYLLTGVFPKPSQPPMPENEGKAETAEETDTIYTHDEAAIIVDMFEGILDTYDITVPSPEDDERDIINNKARLYGSVYSDLLDAVEIKITEILKRHTPVTRVVENEFSGNI